MKKIILKIIKIYQKFVRQGFFIFPFSFGCCRFVPSCSDYTYQAIERYGILKGIVLGCKRILKCQPLSKSGIDQVK